MACEYCYGTFGHDARCPYAPIPKFNHHCSLCKEGIFNGEEYIENNNGDYAHWECFEGTRDLAKFLGCEVKEMEDGD